MRWPRAVDALDRVERSLNPCRDKGRAGPIMPGSLLKGPMFRRMDERLPAAPCALFGSSGAGARHVFESSIYLLFIVKSPPFAYPPGSPEHTEHYEHRSTGVPQNTFNFLFIKEM